MGKIYGAGVNQGDLVDLLVAFKTKINAVLAKLDADSLTDSDYVSVCGITFPATIHATGDKAIRDQGVVLTYLSHVLTQFNALLAKLDADGTVNSTDYVASYGITSPIGGKHLRPAGVNQGSLVYLLNQIITNINGMNAHLDADTGVTATNYASTCNVTDNVVEAGTAA